MSIDDADEDVMLEIAVLVLEASSPCVYSVRVAAIGLDLVDICLEMGRWGPSSPSWSLAWLLLLPWPPPPPSSAPPSEAAAASAIGAAMEAQRMSYVVIASMRPAGERSGPRTWFITASWYFSRVIRNVMDELLYESMSPSSFTTRETNRRSWHGMLRACIFAMASRSLITSGPTSGRLLVTAILRLVASSITV